MGSTMTSVEEQQLGDMDVGLSLNNTICRLNVIERKALSISLCVNFLGMTERNQTLSVPLRPSGLQD